MTNSLHIETVSQHLFDTLTKVILCEALQNHRLVGGTALSLQLGHRISVDIDLFSDINPTENQFNEIEKFLQRNFPYFEKSSINIIGFGKSYFIGSTKEDCIKLDVYSSEPFIDAPVLSSGIAMATIRDIAAMKLDVISRGGRMKDYWDFHAIMQTMSLQELLAAHQKMFPYSHEPDEILKYLRNFDSAEDDFTPVCLRGLHWELIKIDILDFMKKSERH